MGSLTSSSSKNQALITNQQKSQRQGKPPSRGSKGPKSGSQNQVNSFSPSPKQQSQGNKSSKTCTFCGKDGHLESHFFIKMEALNKVMKKHNIKLSPPSTSSSSSSKGKGHSLSVTALIAHTSIK